MTNWWPSNALTSLWSPTNPPGASSQPSLPEPVAANDSTKDVLHDSAANNDRPNEQSLDIPQSSGRDVFTAMSSADGLPTRDPQDDYTTPLTDQRTITRAGIPATASSLATLHDGTGPWKDSIDAILDKPEQSQSMRSDENENENSLLTLGTRERIPQSLAALIDKHSDVLVARVNTEESRTKLKTRRLATGELDAQCMLEVENCLEGNSAGQFADVKHKFRQLQIAKREILALEEEYEEEANRLVQSEADLRDLEYKLYRKLTEPPANSLGQLNEQSPESDWAEQELAESEVNEWDHRIERPPAVRAYRSQQGHVNMLRERLMDRDTQYLQVTEENALREEIGLEPEEDAVKFLASFEAEREALATLLVEAERVLANLAANLEEPENLPIRENPFADPDRRPDGPSREHSLFGKDDYHDDEVMQRDGLANEQVFAAAAALLLTVDDPQLVYADVITDADGISINKASYINSWQLHRLRKSTKEVARLIQELNAAGVRLSPEHLKANVLETWLQDETTHCSHFPHFEIQSRDLSMATHSGVPRHSRPASAPPIQAWQTGEHLMQRRLSTSYAETTR